MTARITEVEAYVGEDDAACHASKGRTRRTEVMFGEAGHAYIYLIYGMYTMLNIVTEQKDFPAAVLVRAVQNDEYVLNGPGKLTRALAIDRSLNGEDLTTSKKLFVTDDGFTVDPKAIHSSPRIGVDYAGEDALLPWRYYVSL